MSTSPDKTVLGGDVIHRCPESAAAERFDAIVVGGGIFGVCVALEAAQRGRRPLLIERRDFGGATSWNSLRILHGGLRYLQTLDLPRFRRSVLEQAWFCHNFSELTRPLPCLMPLYDRGLRRRDLMRWVLLANDYLRRRWTENLLPASQLLDPAAVLDRVRLGDPAGLTGGAWWFDALILNPPRLLIELLRWACSAGATALNYVSAERIATHDGQVSGVIAQDSISGSNFIFRAPVVVNAAGPWCNWLQLSRSAAPVHRFHPSIAWNLVLKRPPLGDFGLAITAPRRNGRTYFAVPRRECLVIGTEHAKCERVTEVPPNPASSHWQKMLTDFNQIVPELNLCPDDVADVHVGYLPADRADSARQAKRPLWLDHRSAGGPAGLVTLVGEKYTTARAAAEALVRQLWPARSRMPHNVRRPARSLPSAEFCDDFESAGATPGARDWIGRLIEEESVQCWEDLILRRTDWAFDRNQTDRITENLRGRWPDLELPVRIARSDVGNLQPVSASAIQQSQRACLESERFDRR